MSINDESMAKPSLKQLAIDVNKKITCLFSYLLWKLNIEWWHG